MIYYYLWQLGSIFQARKFLKTQKIDIVHHLTGGMDWMPSGLSFLGLPFLWGPVGSENIHPVIFDSLPFTLRIKETFRKLVQNLGRHVDPFVRVTGNKAKIILSHTPHNLPSRNQNKILPYMQTGISPTGRFVKMKVSFERGDGFSVVYAGELIHWKGASFAIDAFLNFARSNKRARLKMFGDGPLRRQLQQKVGKSGLGGQVEFRGKVPMDVLIEELDQGDVFLYPSYHHGLATVVLQAMLTGLPVICLEGDAIGRTIGSECGITVPLNKHEDFIHGLSEALSLIHSDESLRVALAKRGREVAINTYSYQTIGAGYDDIYRKLSEKTGDGKP